MGAISTERHRQVAPNIEDSSKRAEELPKAPDIIICFKGSHPRDHTFLLSTLETEQLSAVGSTQRTKGGSQETWIQVPSRILTGFVSKGKTPGRFQQGRPARQLGQRPYLSPRATVKVEQGSGVHAKVTAAKHRPHLRPRRLFTFKLIKTTIKRCPGGSVG